MSNENYPKSIKDLADLIDPREAQIAIARQCFEMGSLPDWDSQTIERVAEHTTWATRGINIPSFTATSLAGEEYYESLPEGF